MKVIDAIFSRRSVREFKDKDVPFEKIMDCVEAASWAPSAGNLQNVRFVIVRNEKSKRAVTSASYDQQWLMQAPCLVVVCNDPSDVVKSFPDDGERFASHAAAASAMNFMLAAQELGLSTCWVGAFDSFALSRDLNIPNSVIPEIVIAVGYAFESPKSSRLSPELLVHFDSWGTKTSKGIGVIHSVKQSVKGLFSSKKKSP